nr:unnamed protein product [Callosobruchus chinensis]
MPKRQRDSDRIRDSKTRKKRKKYEGLLKRLREKIAVSSTDTGSYDTQNSSDSDGENEITTVAEIHPVPEAAVAVNSSDVMLDNNAHVCDFEFLGVKPKANNTASEPLHTELAVRWNTFLQGGVLKECRENIMEKYPLFEDCPLKLTSRQFYGQNSRADWPYFSRFGLADAAQLICNVHHAISTHRKYNILPFLKYSARKIVETSKSDIYFFGKNFVADLKATDAAKKNI